MLVLSRKKGESIMIGQDIEVVVIEASGSRVRLGVKAPPEVAVHRQGVFQKIKEEEQPSRLRAHLQLTYGDCRFERFAWTEGL